MTFTKNDGSKINIDLPLELLIESGTYDELNKQIILTLANGNVINIPLSDLLDDLYTKEEVDKKLEDTTQELETKIAELELENTRQQEDINSLLEELPNNTAEGSDLHITDSAKARASISPLGNTEQDTREGYNQVNVNSVETVTQNGITISSTDDYFEASGICTVNFSFPIEMPKKLSPGIYYIYSYGTITSLSYTLRNQNKEWLTDIYLDDTGLPRFTITEEGIYYLGVKFVSGTTYNDKYKIMVVAEADKDKVYEQYGSMPSIDYKSDVRVVEGSYENKVQNKNILKTTLTSRVLNGIEITVNEETDEITLNGTSTNIINEVLGTFDVKKDLLYVQSLTNKQAGIGTNANNHEAYLNVNYFNIPSSATSSLGKVTNALKDGKDIKLNLYVANGTVLNNFKFKAQVEVAETQGDTATDYIPHAEQNYPLDFPEGMEFAKGDEIELTYTEKNGYKTIDRDSMYHLENSGEYVFTGDEVFTLYSSNPNRWVLNITASQINMKDSTTNALCTHYKYRNSAIGLTTYFVTGNTYAVQFYDNSFETAEQLQEYLKQQYNNGTPVKVRYETATPTRTKITDENFISQYEKLLNSSTYKGVTNISTTKQSDTQATLNLKVDYKQSNSLRIDALEKAILSLGGNI